MKKYIISLLVLTAFVTVRCKKDQMGDQLPPITTSGDNTFGCKVDGKVWLPYSSIRGGNIYALWVQGPDSLYSKYTVLSIYADNRAHNDETNVDLILKGITHTGIYQIHNILSEGLSYSDGTMTYEPYDTFGIVNILRLDTIANIVSGTFSFRGSNKQFNKTVNITDGRFDVHWPYKY